MTAGLRLRTACPPMIAKFGGTNGHPAKEPPSGSDWLHEIKHGFRLMAVRMLPASDDYPQGQRFHLPLSLHRALTLPSRRCPHAFSTARQSTVMTTGLAVFELIRPTGPALRLHSAFDLTEPDAEDMRGELVH